MSTLGSLLLSLPKARILVIGDAILDRYTWGHAERISPEAPVMVLHADHEEVRLGGAASVATLLRALDADADLAAVTGDDGPSRLLRTLCAEAGIGQFLVSDTDRVTTVKERFMGRAANRHPQQMLRVDREHRHAISAPIERQVLDLVLPALSDYPVVLVEDHNKGTCTESLLEAVFERAHAHGISILVDPARTTDYTKYRGATVLAPNRAEAESVTRRTIASQNDAVAAARMLVQITHVEVVLLKLDSDGMLVYHDDGRHQFVSTRPREVYDVTGAGDMVFAMAGLCAAARVDWAVTAELANIAAGLEVERLGVTPVARAEVAQHATTGTSPGKLVGISELETLRKSWRRQGRRVIFTNGCFDLLHPGHVTFLEQAARLGDILIVAVNADASVRRLKGPDRPFLREADRFTMLAALQCVDYVVVFAEETPAELLRRLQPDALVKGGTTKEVVGREIVEAYGGTAIRIPTEIELSTTALADLIRRPPARF